MRHRIVLSLLIIILAQSVLPQTKTITRQQGSTVSVNPYTEIVEATKPCTPAECEWWSELRAAASDLQRKMDEKSKKRFAILFAEALQKNYRIPIGDQGPKVLSFRFPVFPAYIQDRQRQRLLRGSVELSIEYRAEGFIGDVKLLKGMQRDVDDAVIRAARQSIFLPAVVDGHFTTAWEKSGMTFSTDRR